MEKLGFEDVTRIPILPSGEMPVMDREYVLITPTYGGGVSISQAHHVDNRPVPPQVRKFLSIGDNASNIVAVIASGNLNFGVDYGIAGDVISKKFGVPYVYRFELLGTPEDVRIVRQGITEFFGKIAEDH